MDKRAKFRRCVLLADLALLASACTKYTLEASKSQRDWCGGCPIPMFRAPKALDLLFAFPHSSEKAR